MQSFEEIIIRNNRVDADKAWEISRTRRAAIGFLIYLTAFVFMVSLGVAHSALNALIPAIGYGLSTLSLPFLKKMWFEKIYKTGANS